MRVDQATTGVSGFRPQPESAPGASFFRPRSRPHLRVHATRSGTLHRLARLYWKRADWLALVLIILVATRLQELFSFVALIRPALLALVLGSILLATKATPSAVRSVFSYRPARVVLGFWAVMALSIPFALWPALAFKTTQALAASILLFLAILFCSPLRRTVDRLTIGLVAGAAVYGLYAKLAGYTGADGRLEAGSGMYDSNDMASLMAICFPLAVLLGFRHRGKLRFLGFGTALLLVVVVIASGSRGGTLALAAGGIVLPFGARGIKRIPAVVMLVLAMVSVWSFGGKSFRDRMTSLTSLEQDYNYTDEYGRKQIWKRGRGYYREHPVIGVGAGNFPIAEGGNWADENRRGKWSNAHNAYVQVFAELGTIGGGLFVMILFVAFRRSFRLWRGVRIRDGTLLHRPELFAALCAYMVAAYFLSAAYYPPLYALLGIIFLADRAAIVEQAGSRSPIGATRMRRSPHGNRGAPVLPPSSLSVEV